MEGIKLFAKFAPEKEFKTETPMGYNRGQIKMEKNVYSTNYKIAVNWCNNNLILCNDICNIDSSVWDNMRFEVYNEENDTYREIYQWFLTDCNETDVEFLETHFDLKFTYSEKLDLYILCVDHYGTSWDYVYCDTDLECAKRNLGEDK